MALQLDELLDAGDLLSIDGWWFERRSKFIESALYETLTRELGRYLKREVDGRSFLIAAHRGGGKTFIVNRAVQDANRQAIIDAREQAKLPLVADQRADLQRPLLVKLHGRALIAAVQSADAAGGVSGPATAEAALQQITAALYRALAREVAASFARHARQPPPSGAPRDWPELAAQLALDLDLAPSIARLRAFWDRLERLQRGVLWPDSIGRRLADLGFADRGMREIVALATANQAFQIVAGTVQMGRNQQETAELKASIEAAGRLDGKELVNRLSGLAAGVAVGGGLWAPLGAAGATAAGAAMALLGAAAFSWSSSRIRRQALGADYSFVVKPDLQSLDRDLPEVIERIREAGLAPVFLIDELDKLEEPAKAIEAIVRRLKNLTTDYGFFCWLTDRSYYETVAWKLSTNAFPPEHTFFSHRRLLIYRPMELAAYVKSLLVGDNDDDVTAAWVLTCYVLHEARLNTMDIRRELSRFCNAKGELSVTTYALLNERRFLVPMAVQLAIEHVLRQEKIRARVEADDEFAQLATDVLYYLPRAWAEPGPPELAISAAVVRDGLQRRRRAAWSWDRDTTSAFSASEADIEDLTEMLVYTADLLTDFAMLSASIGRDPPASGPQAQSENDKRARLLPKVASLALEGAAGLLGPA